MPYAIQTRDGITIQNIPDDVPRDSDELKQRVAQIRQQRAGQSAAPERPSTADEFVGALGRTLRAGAEGVAGTVGIFSDPVAALINQVLPEEKRINTMRSAVSDLLTQVGVPEPRDATERLINEVIGAGAGAGGTAALARAAGAIAQSPVARGVAEALAAQPGQQVAGAAGAAAAGGVAREEGAGPVGQALSALAGGVAGAGLAGLSAGQRVTPGAIKAMQEAESRGIRAMTSDVAPPRTFAGRWAQASGERIPVAGTGGMRAEQQGQRINAIRDTLRQFGADDVAAVSDDVMADLAKTRGAQLTKYTAMKNDVFSRVKGKGAVPVSRTVAAIDDQIASLQSLRTKETDSLVSALDDFKSSIQNQDIDNIEILRKQLGEKIKSPELSSVRSTGEKVTSKIYGSLNGDIGDFIKNAGERRDFDKWQIANRALSEMMGELKSTGLRSILQKGSETPEVVERLLFSPKPSEVRLLYRNLSPRGRAAAQTAIMKRAADQAGGFENISPEKFATSVDKLGKSIGVFFKKEDLRAIEGLSKALRVTSRAGEFAASPPTGVQMSIPVGAAILTDMLGGAGAGIATGAAIGGASRLLESRAVRDILIKLPSVRAGTPEEAALIKRLLAVMQATSAQEKEPAQ